MSNSPMLHRLEWSTEQCQEFLRRKINALSDEWLTGGSTGRPTERWLGRTSIENERRGCAEDIEAYILRHTLLLPRDVVEMGNCLCDAITKARARGRATLTDDEVRGAVHRAAKQIGKTGVYCSGIEVARRLMPSDAPLHGAGEAYGLPGAESQHNEDDDMTHAISDQYAFLLTRVVKKAGKDRFDAGLLQVIKDAVSTELTQTQGAEEVEFPRFGGQGLVRQLGLLVIGRD